MTPESADRSGRVPDTELDNATRNSLSKRQRWVAYVVGGLLGLALAPLALVAVTFT